jgi:hypothetical protein
VNWAEQLATHLEHTAIALFGKTLFPNRGAKDNGGQHPDMDAGSATVGRLTPS